MQMGEIQGNWLKRSTLQPSGELPCEDRVIDRHDPRARYARLPAPVRKRLAGNEVYKYVEITP